MARKSNATKEKEAKKSHLLTALETNYTLISACAVVGVTTETARLWRKEDPEFAEAVDELRQRKVATVAERAFAMASSGNDAGMTRWFLATQDPANWSTTNKAEVKVEQKGRITLEWDYGDEDSDT